MLRALMLIALIGTALVAPPAAEGAAPIKATDHTVTLSCDSLSGAAGTAFLGVSLSDTYGPDAYLDVFSGQPYVDPADLTRDYGAAVDASFSSGSLSATIPLVDVNGSPAGSAVVAATLAPVGDPSAPGSFRDGNVWFKASGTIQPEAVTGTLTLPGGAVYALDACYGEEATISTFQTNPNALVRHFASRSVSCDLSDPAGDSGSIFIDLSDSSVFLDASLTSADGAVSLEASGQLSQVNGTVAGDLPTFDLATGQPLPDATTIAMTLAGSGQRFTYTLRNATSTRRISGQAIDVEGTLAFPGGYIFDLGACIAIDQTIKEVVSSPKGPKPSGKAPSNDLPAGAILLAPGARATIQTKAAAPLREVPYPCMVSTDPFTGETFEIMIGNTVWYRVAGTGSAVTVDTAGSDYDTVAAVYTSDGAGGFAPVGGACVDDVPLTPVGRTLQAAVTFPTVSGVTYYVQIGGFPESFPYGTLKVAVR